MKQHALQRQTGQSKKSTFTWLHHRINSVCSCPEELTSIHLFKQTTRKTLAEGRTAEEEQIWVVATCPECKERGGGGGGAGVDSLQFGLTA